MDDPRVPKEATLTGFADDLTVAVVAKQPKDMELHRSDIHSIKALVRGRSLLLIAGKRILRVGNRKVVS